MDLRCTLWCLALLLCGPVKFDRADADKRLVLDEVNRLRNMWLLSVKQLTLKAAGSHTGPVTRHGMNQLLYCRVGIGYHLQILTNGTVGGVHEPTKYSWLGVFAMKPGVVGIRGTESRLYLCMNKEGIAHGTKEFSSDCLFKERLEENHYTTYSSAAHPGLYLAMSRRGRLKRGGTVDPRKACTHFLPRMAKHQHSD
ncbi:fibroblast growth factor 4A-like [Brachyhypopomus gauderio]|uniref:fibroblast growth factor 4A-like n=1 Tax=Brachyhypopomus gauderio TaxID=698409 RepID=UPI004041E3D0